MWLLCFEKCVEEQVEYTHTNHNCQSVFSLYALYCIWFSEPFKHATQMMSDNDVNRCKPSSHVTRPTDASERVVHGGHFVPIQQKQQVPFGSDNRVTLILHYLDLLPLAPQQTVAEILSTGYDRSLLSLPLHVLYQSLVDPQAQETPPSPPKFGQKLFFGQKLCKIRAFCYFFRAYIM